ncbi:MAG: DUF4126 domain-containing protein [Planctomycetota bacterium]|nr:DUF4126 domain-containing protein [Planctomycetota bacterium]
MQNEFQTLLGVLAGIGLAAACGFRVFVPMLVAGIAIRSGALHAADGFQWLGSTPALIALSVATVLEVGGYYIPGLDHLLDTIASPAAVVAGTLVTASFVTDVEPWFRWTLAAVAGGGAAALVQGATVVARGASGLFTFGLANPLVATAEFVGATVASVLSLVAPVVVIAGLLVLVALLVHRLVRRYNRRRSTVPA